MTKSTLTRDELNEVVATYGKSHIVHRMAKQLLAAMDSEPVAEVIAYYPLGIGGGKQKFVQVIGELPDFGAQLYAVPQPAPVVPMELRNSIKAEALAEMLRDAHENMPLAAAQWEVLAKNWHQTFLGLSGEENACHTAMLNGGKS